MASEKSSKFESVYNELLKSIQNGDFLPGEKLLAESELAAKYNVSRNTLRQAITLLVQDGYLTNQQGRGTFVLQNIPEESNSFERITDPMVKAAKNSVTDIITVYSIIVADDVLQKNFRVDSSKLFLKIHIVYKTDDQVIGFTDSEIPYDLAAGSKVPLDNIEAIYDFYRYQISRSDVKAKTELSVSVTDFGNTKEDLYQQENAIKLDSIYKDKAGNTIMTQTSYMNPCEYVITFYKTFGI